MQVKGTELKPSAKAEALRGYINRYTKTHVPEWAKRPRPDGTQYMPQFKDDNDWLEHTLFYITKNGDLDKRNPDCESSPTWPDGMNGPVFDPLKLPADYVPPSRFGGYLTDCQAKQLQALIRSAGMENIAQAIEYRRRRLKQGDKD